MSPQLTISSIFATLAMAWLCLASLGGGLNHGSIQPLISMQAEIANFDRSDLDLFR